MPPRLVTPLLNSQAPTPDEPDLPAKKKRVSAKERAIAAKLAARRAESLRLAAEGHPYRHIAELLKQQGYESSDDTVRRDLKALYDEYGGDSQETLHLMRLTHAARGNQLISSLLPQVMNVPTAKNGQPLATKTAYERQSMLGKLIIEIEAHEAKLFGAYAPARVQQEVTGRDGGPIETYNEHALASLSTQQLATIARLASLPVADDRPTEGEPAPGSVDTGGETA